MTKRKRIMAAFKMNEISGVDEPAQVGARTTLMKRDDKKKKPKTDKDGDPLVPDNDEEEGQKGTSGKTTKYVGDYTRPAATSDSKGHAHLLDLASGEAGETSWARSDEEENGHTHVWVRNDDGKIEILIAEGHNHVMLDATKSTGGNSASGGQTLTGEPEMSDKTQKTTGTQEAETVTKDAHAVVQKQLEKANRLAELNDAQKAHYGELSDADKETFLAKSADAREADVTATQAADPVVYKDLSGNEYRKSDDHRVVAAVKRADATEKALRLSEATNKSATLAKRADDELGNLTGEVTAKAALLDAVDGIEDEATRKNVSAILKAANETTVLETAFQSMGTNNGGNPEKVGKSAATSELEQLAKKYSEVNKVDMVNARVEVLSTPEGDALYRQTL